MQNAKPTIIAEIGFNHEGDMDRAKEMIRAAAQAGADIVKFQTFRPQDIVLPGSEHFDIIRPGEMDLDMHKDLAAVATQAGVEFMSTPFSNWAVDILESVGVKRYKIASMDLNNRLLLSRIAETGKPVILSTGMTVLSELTTTMEFLHKRKVDVTLLHCNAEYPSPAENLNLAAIPFLRQTFGVPVGYSDHYPGVKACLAAAMIGADVIETHFTLDNSWPGADHAHSADPKQLRNLIDEIALFLSMRGADPFLGARPDRENAKEWRRGIYAARDIRPGEMITEEDLLCSRPEAAFTVDQAALIMGKTVRKNITAGMPLAWDMLE